MIVDYDLNIFLWSSLYLLSCLVIKTTAEFFILSVLAFLIWNFSLFLSFMLWVLLFISKIFAVFLFDNFFLAKLRLWIFRRSFCVGSLSSIKLSSYEFLFPVMSYTATFCTLSSSFSFIFVRLEFQTTHDCSRTLLMNTL